jgi:hypothetical protein
MFLRNKAKKYFVFRETVKNPDPKKQELAGGPFGGRERLRCWEGTGGKGLDRKDGTGRIAERDCV